MFGEDVAQRFHRHLQDLGPLPGSTVGNLHTLYSVDWGCG